MHLSGQKWLEKRMNSGAGFLCASVVHTSGQTPMRFMRAHWQTIVGHRPAQ
jgi:hypothetical protein